MRNLILRKTVVPVEARRVQIPGERVESPPAAHIPQAGVTQNIVYVQVPVAQPTFVAPATETSPREVHYHTTNVYHAPQRPRLRRRGSSFLGGMGFVLGVLAAGMVYWPQTTLLAGPVALVGLALAGLGIVGAMLLGRVGTLLPLLGLLASGAAYLLFLQSVGQLPRGLKNTLPTIEFNTGSPPPPAAAK